MDLALKRETSSQVNDFLQGLSKVKSQQIDFGKLLDDEQKEEIKVDKKTWKRFL